MGRKLTPKIILEGTRLTFKTDLAFALNEHPRIVGPAPWKPMVSLSGPLSLPIAFDP